MRERMDLTAPDLIYLPTGLKAVVSTLSRKRKELANETILSLIVAGLHAFGEDVPAASLRRLEHNKEKMEAARGER